MKRSRGALRLFKDELLFFRVNRQPISRFLHDAHGRAESTCIGLMATGRRRSRTSVDRAYILTTRAREEDCGLGFHSLNDDFYPSLIRHRKGSLAGCIATSSNFLSDPSKLHLLGREAGRTLLTTTAKDAHPI